MCFSPQKFVCTIECNPNNCIIEDSPQKFVCTIKYNPNNYIIEGLDHSWGTSLKNCLDAVLIRF